MKSSWNEVFIYFILDFLTFLITDFFSELVKMLMLIYASHLKEVCGSVAFWSVVTSAFALYDQTICYQLCMKIFNGPPICTLELNMNIVFMCECMCLCLVLHLLYRFTGSFDLTPLHWDFLILCLCALSRFVCADTWALCWDSREDNVVLLRNTCEQAAPYKNHPMPLAQPPANASPISLSKRAELMGVLHVLKVKNINYFVCCSSKYQCWPHRIPFHVPRSVHPFHWHFDILSMSETEEIHFFHVMHGTTEFNSSILTSNILYSLMLHTGIQCDTT